ncbi:amidohydrolase family protein, partial [Salinimicrobium sp. CDJ15-91]|nr:amidohydrolase family protein [Salinimicrobium oceani]
MKKLLWAIFLLFGLSAAAQDIYIQSGNLIDTKTGKILGNHTVIVSGKKIKSVEKGFVQPAKASDSLIDLREMFVLPGLTDMHVHLESETNPSKYLDRFTNNEADDAFNSVGF